MLPVTCLIGRRKSDAFRREGEGGRGWGKGREEVGVLVFFFPPPLISSWLVLVCTVFFHFSMWKHEHANSGSALQEERAGWTRASENEKTSAGKPRTLLALSLSLAACPRPRRHPPPSPRLPRGLAPALGARGGRASPHIHRRFFRAFPLNWSAPSPPSSRATPRRLWGGRSRQRECGGWCGVARGAEGGRGAPTRWICVAETLPPPPPPPQPRLPDHRGRLRPAGGVRARRERHGACVWGVWRERGTPLSATAGWGGSRLAPPLDDPPHASHTHTTTTLSSPHPPHPHRSTAPSANRTTRLWR